LRVDYLLSKDDVGRAKGAFQPLRFNPILIVGWHKQSLTISAAKNALLVLSNPPINPNDLLTTRSYLRWKKGSVKQ
jgi:hypothetical protein